jgi:hypothetical protein
LICDLRRCAIVAEATELDVAITIGVDMARANQLVRKLGFRQTGGNDVVESVM